jgi:hypothetical protein
MQARFLKSMRSLTQAISIPVMVLHVIRTVTSGSKVVLTVSLSTAAFGKMVTWFLNSGNLDVINVSGHRLSTAEIESALILHSGVAETAGERQRVLFKFIADQCLISYRYP